MKLSTFVWCFVLLFIASTTFGQHRPPLSDDEMRARIPGDVTFSPNVAYRDGNEAWQLDLYMSAEMGSAPRPGLVFVHGGAFFAGDKRYDYARDRVEFWYLELILEYAKAGYVVISVNYRLAGEAPFPAAIEDVKTAIRWFRANADEYNVDPSRIGGFGHSAGAHLVALAALAGPEAGFEGDGPNQEESSALQAACLAALSADLGGMRKTTGTFQFLAGPADGLAGRARKASPITYVRRDAPSLFLIHGTEDFLHVEDVEEFAETLRETGAEDVTLMIFHSEGHGALVDQFELTQPAIRTFFDRTIRMTTSR